MTKPVSANPINSARKLVVLLFIAVLAATICAASAQPAYAETETDVTKDGFAIHVWYGDSGASVAVKQYSGSSTQVILPTSITVAGKDYPASSSSNWYMLYNTTFKNNTKVTKIAIPDGYDTIEIGAFNGCTALTEVAIGDSVSYLSNSGDTGALTGCSAKTYYFKGENVSQEMVEKSGIGTDAGGNPIAGVTVWTKEGSNVDKAIQELNKSRPANKQITLKYDSDPYSKNTVKPTSDTGGSSSPALTNGGDSSDSSSGSNGSTATTTTQKGEDGTDFGKGASEQVTEKAILALAKKNDADPKGTVFNALQARATKATNKAITLKWKKVTGATKYVVYGNKCGLKNKYKKLTTVKKTTITLKKVAGKKVAKGTYYKFIIVAVDKNGKVLSTSKTIHAATTGGKVGNSKSVTVKAKVNGKLKKVSKVTIKKGKKLTLKATDTPKNKKFPVKHHRKIAFESTNKNIATVSAKGVITAKAKGTCYIYAYAQNGVFKTVKVTVK